MQSENFLLVSITAEKFGARPSCLVGLHDPVLALDFDLAAAARLLDAERRAESEGDAEFQSGGDALPLRAREEFW